MSYALVLPDTEYAGRRECKFRRFQFLCGWLSSFIPGRIEISPVELTSDFYLYFITMPPPRTYYAKNKWGRKRTMKKLHKVLKDNGIDSCLIEKEMQVYVGSGWSDMDCYYLSDSLKQKVVDLFQMDPLKEIDYGNKILTVSGAEKKWMTAELACLFKKFKLINVLRGESMDDWWEMFMNETGVPVCQTNEEGVLKRSDIWISFKKAPAYSLFTGIHIDLAGKIICYADSESRYKVEYGFDKYMNRKLGFNVIRKLGSNKLACFLIHALIQKRKYSPVLAEQNLGIKIMVVSG